MTDQPATQDIVFESRLDHPALSFLEDHRIRGVAVFPAIGYVEMGLSAAEAVLGAGSYAIAELNIQAAMILPARRAQTLRLVVSTNGPGQITFQAFGKPADASDSESSWTLHASGQVIQDASPPDFAPAEGWLQAVQDRREELLSATEFYRRFAAKEFVLGPTFQGVVQVWRRDGEALALVRRPAVLGEDDGPYQIHPAFLDACFQIVGIALPRAKVATSQDLYLPIALGKVRIHRPLPAVMWSHIAIQPVENSDEDAFIGDIHVVDENHQLVAELLGVKVWRVGQSIRHAKQDVLNKWLYELQWQSQPRSASAPPASAHDTSTQPGMWLVFADRGGIGESVATHLKAHGQECALIFPGETFQRIKPGQYVIDPTQAENFQRLVQDLLGQNQLPCRGVIHLWSLNLADAEATTIDSLKTAQTLGCGSALFLVQSLARLGGGITPRLWLVTQGAEAVEETTTPTAVAQAPLWGFGRVIAVEHPELWGGLIDVDPQGVTDQAAALFEEIWNPDAENQIAFRGRNRYVLRLARKPQAQRTATALQWRPEASYLITGGLGGLGLTVARWMVEQGARQLILVGRTALPPRATWEQAEAGSRLEQKIAAIRELEALGASVYLAAVDVADAAQLSSFLEKIQNEQAPIRGVVHAAGVLRDKTLMQLDVAALDAVWRPKVTGSWLLHHLLQDSPLDFFVLFSSSASVLGSPGQANYSAANAFLDALAHHRRSREQVALSVNWGPWAQVGMAARTDQEGRFVARGMEHITPEQGLDILELLLQQETPQTAVLPIFWSEWRRIYPAINDSPFFAHLADGKVDDKPGSKGTSTTTGITRAELLVLEPDQRHARVVTYLQDQVAQVLELPADRLDVNQPLTAMGIDSLMALDLRNRTTTDLGIQLPVANLLEGPSTIQLADYLVAELDKATLAEEKDTLPAVEPTRTEFPLSYGQQALWFIHQLAPESGAYNTVEAIHIEDEIDVPAMQRALHKLVARHPIMRTTFVAPDGIPIQKVHEEFNIPIEAIDASNWTETQLNNHMNQQMKRVFDLERGPLLSFTLYSRSPRDHIVLLAMHHLMWDFWSLLIFLRDMDKLYWEELTDTPANLPPLTRQYADFVQWEAEMLASPKGEEHWTYWQQQLSGELPVLNLPTDYPRPAVKTYRGALHVFALDETVSQQLTALAQAEGATSFMVTLAAFVALLHRYSGQDDIIVGSPLSTRDHPDLAGVIGYFLNPLPLRANLAGNPSFLSLLRQIRETVLGALRHQSYPFSLIVDRLQPPRDASRSPLFDTMFVSRNVRDDEGVAAFSQREAGMRMNLNSIPIETMAVERDVAQFDLTLAISDVEGKLGASWEYNTDLFKASTIAKITAHFQTLVAGIVAHPEQPLKSLPLLSAAEQYQVWHEWNNTDMDLPYEQLLHQPFEAQAARTPRALAVVSNGHRLNYQSLERRANQVAHWLRQQGARPNTLVAVMMEKGWEQVVAVLGILKAGAAYLPLDPKLPRERLAYLAEQGQVELVLTQPWLDEVWAWLSDTRRLPVDAQSLQGLPEQPLTPVQQPTDLAYVIFTSGSTGLPKGVMIDHRGAVNTILDINQRFAIGSKDKVLALSSLSFDLSVYDVFGTLAVGGTIVMPDAARVQDLTHWAALAVQEHVTVWNSVPALFQLLVDYVTGKPEMIPHSLRLALLSGDWIPVALPDQAKALLPEIAVIGLGGATEASIWSICYPIETVAADWTSIPYGRPMWNQRFYVLDEALNPCPVGVAGQLYIGGIGLAQGYWRDEEKTNKSFITHPQTGERLYRTGDLGRYWPDGTIEFLGRLDHQVKIRGFRVEIGEIETVLGQHPTVRETVVLAREDTPGEKRLVAYVIAKASSQLDAGQLRHFLEQRLPDYMVPSAFVTLDRLPLTPNGKVNRRALPAPQYDRSQLAVPFAPPRNPTEEVLADIWREVLRLDQVGIHDNFFALGGDSVLGIQASVRGHQAGLRLSPQQIFEHQTIAELAAVVKPLRTVQAEQGPVSGPVPLSPSQHLFFAQPPPDPNRWSAALLLQARQPLDRACLEQALNHLLYHHDALRLRFKSTPTGWEQYNAAETPPLVCEQVQLADVPPSQRATALAKAVATAQASLDLSAGPLLRAVLFDLGPEEQERLLIVVHRLAMDGVSWPILLADLQTAYYQLEQGQTIVLPAKTTSFQYWAQALKRYGRSEAMREEASYWRQALPNTVAPLPRDFTTQTEGASSTETVTVSLSPAETKTLLQEVPRAYQTRTDEVLLTALAQTLSPWIGSQGLLVDVEAHARADLLPEVDLSRTIGWLTAPYPLWLRLPEEGDPGQALQAVKEQVRRVPRQGIGYGLLRQLAADDPPTAELPALPTAEVSFDYLGWFDRLLGAEALFELAQQAAGPLYDPQGQSWDRLAVIAGVFGEQLHIHWRFNPQTHRRETITGLAETFLSALRTLVLHTLSLERKHYTPSDFPLAQLDQQQLDKIRAKFV